MNNQKEIVMVLNNKRKEENFEKLFSLVSAKTSYDLKQHQKEIKYELQKLGVSQKKQMIFLQFLNKIRNITYNPKTQASLFRSFFRIAKQDIDKDGRGSSIIIEITKKCNKNCVYCYSKLKDKIESISNKTLDIIIRYARKNFKHIFLTGGEPTMDPRIFTLAEHNPDIIFFIFTNGSLITSAYSQRLSKLGNIIPLIGIDGSKPSTHDAYRGKGSYNEVLEAINHLNKSNVSWGFISLVTEHNATEILSQEFLNSMIQKGAIIARYLEYIPVGPKPLNDCILSGETYYLLEKRKSEIIKSKTIYTQDISEKKCNGLLFFSVSGDIQNCFCFHYTKYNVNKGNIKQNINRIKKDWTSYKWCGECPLYSDPKGFKNHLIKLGWKNRYNIEEPYLNNDNISQKLQKNYTQFLKIKAKKGF